MRDFRWCTKCHGCGYSTLPNRNPYQTRHTYASMMLSAGEHPMWAAKQMGHSSWVMIARVYGRWIPNEGDTSGGKAAALFGTSVQIPMEDSM